MMNRLKDQRKSGILISYISYLIHILSSLLYTPIMLRLLGKNEYGLYQLVYSLVAYLSILSFGFHTSYIRFYSKLKANNDKDKISRLNGMFLTLFFMIAIISLVIGAIFIGNAEIVFGSKLSMEEILKAKVLTAILVVSMASTFINSVFDCFTTAHNRFVFQKSMILIQNILNPLVALPLLFLGYGSVGIVMVAAAITIAKLGCNVYYCLNILKIKFLFHNYDWDLFKRMWSFTFFIFMNLIIDQINWNSDKYLLGYLKGTAAVAVYGVANSLNAIFRQLSGVITSVFSPQINMLAIQENAEDQLTRLFTRVGRVIYCVIIPVLIGFAIWGKAFIHLWAGKGYENAYYVALLIMVPISVPLMQGLGIEIQRAKNMHKARSVAYFFISIANILISIPLINSYGEIGAAFGTTLAVCAGHILFMNWYYHNRIGLNMIQFWKKIMGFLPGTILITISGLLIDIFFPSDTWLTLLLSLSFYLLLYMLIIWNLGLNKEEKSILYSVINRK